MAEMMNAQVFYEAEKMQLEQIPVPHVSDIDVLVKVKNRLTYLEDEIKQTDWAKESPKDYREALAALIKAARQIVKEIPNDR